MITVFKQLKDSTASQLAMDSWRLLSPRDEMPNVDRDYKEVRDDLERLFFKIKETTEKDYFIDVRFGIALKEYFENKSWFSLRTASEVGFWRYLSLMVIPNVVKERWEFQEDHYWKKPKRIWLRTIWLYAYVSWNRDAETTREMLEQPMFTTDTILNLIERSGRKGMNIDLYRCIMKKYSESNELRLCYARGKNREPLFRAIMRLNTARTMVYEPALFEGGVEGYVKDLFKFFERNMYQM